MKPWICNLCDLALDGLKKPDKSGIDWIIAGTMVIGFAFILFSGLDIVVNHNAFDHLAFGAGGTAIMTGQSINLFAQNRSIKTPASPPPVE